MKRTCKKYASALLAALLPCFLSPTASLGAVAHVSVGNNFFSPATTNIHPGDQVIWTWTSGSQLHNVVSASSPFAWLFPSPGGGAGTTANQDNSNLRDSPFAFTNTFNSAGSFPYECTDHVTLGMAGTITVASSTGPTPTISITRPANGATFAAPASVTIDASASVSSGRVTNVSFFAGATKLGSVRSSPFDFTATGLAAGTYSLTAVATAGGVSATSAAVSISVASSPPPTNVVVAGTYAGLFWDTNNLSNTSSGWFSATVTSKGAVNGQLKIAGASATFTTKLPASGAASFTVPRHNKDPLAVTLQFDLSGTESATGTVSDASNTFNAQLTAYRAGFSATNHAAAYEGYYTWAMPPASGVAPAGNSYGTATVAATGTAALSVHLGDGATASASGSLSKNGWMPLYVSLYNGQGSFLAWLSFNNSSGGLSTNGAFWFKDGISLFKIDATGTPEPITVAAGVFPNGFTLTDLRLFLAPYVAAGKGANALGSASAAIQLTGADLTNSITATIALNSAGIGGAGAGLSVNISGKTGLYMGSFKDPASATTTHFAGAVLQPAQTGYGSFIGGGLPGAVALAPSAESLPSVPPGNIQVSPEFNRAGNILIADQWNNRAIEISPSGRIVWSFGLGPLDFSANSPISVNDVERVGDYTLMANPGDTPGVIPQAPNGSVDNRVLLVDPLGNIVWQYGQFGQTGDGSNLLSTPVQCTFVPGFKVLITDQGNSRVIEVNYDKEIVWQYPPDGDTNAADQLNAPNSAELLANGHILIADQGNSRALEVTSSGVIGKTLSAGGTVNTLAFASRLANGDTLLTDAGNSRIVEVNSEDKVVWQYFTTNNAPGSPARPMSVASPQPTRAVRLADGNTLISDQLNNRVILVNHAGKFLADYGLPLPKDGGTFSGGSAGILIGDNVGYSLFTTQAGLYSPYDAKVIGDYTGLTPPLKK